MKTHLLFILFFGLFQQVCFSQAYKGIFAGLNVTTTQQDLPTTGAHVGWHVGYAIRGDLQKKVAPQLEFLLMSEGFSTGEEDFHIVLYYVKAPLLVNCRSGDYSSPFRILLGVQPTLYMGGFAKEGERLYSLTYFLNQQSHVEPGLGYDRSLDGKLRPGLWNVEGVGGFEVIGNRVNFGVRLHVGFLSKNRFRNSGLSFRIGF
ncbi:MAG: hypothetical protein AAFZ15_16260 [Bacteroidota bacterium]